MADDETGGRTDDIEASIVEYFYERQVSGHRCGYCGSGDSFVTNGMWGHRLAGQDYQDLIERGWRRSGKYLYKPIMNRTCCPLYAIRCEALRYKPSRSQRRVARRMKAFLVEGREPLRASRARGEKGNPDNNGSSTATDKDKGKREVKEKSTTAKEKEVNSKECEGKNGDDGAGVSEGPEEGSGTDTLQKTSPTDGKAEPRLEKMETEAVSKKKAPRPGVGADPSKPRCRKAKEVRLERKKKKLVAKEATAAEATVSKCDKVSSELVDESGKTDEPVRKGDGTNNQETLAKEDNTTVSEDDSKKKESVSCSEDDPKPKTESVSQTHTTVEELLQLPTDQPMAHRLEVKVVDCYPLTQQFLATFIESYQLYKKYQMHVHGDKEEELSERSFRRFLCDTPLISLDGPAGWEHKYGSFHLQYYLDGKMIMVAVVDILPTYLSSVYVYYDPDHRWLDLGVYSALREIELVRKLSHSKPEFQYYCMGYYLHNNKKMSYKGGYSPSYLLCPDTYRFVPLEVARLKLDKEKHSRLNDEPFVPERVVSFLGGVLILFEKQVIPYMLFRSYYGRVKDRVVVEYASLVGREVTQRMFLYVLLDGSQQDDDSDS